MIEEAQPGIPAGVQGCTCFTRAGDADPGAAAHACVCCGAAEICRPLRAAQGWLQRHNRVIVMVVSLAFGIYFLYRGIAGLLAVCGM